MAAKKVDDEFEEFWVYGHKEAGDFLVRATIHARSPFHAVTQLGSMHGLPWGKWHDITVYDAWGTNRYSYDPKKKVAGNNVLAFPRQMGPATSSTTPSVITYPPRRPYVPPPPPACYSAKIVGKLPTGETIRESH